MLRLLARGSSGSVLLAGMLGSCAGDGGGPYLLILDTGVYSRRRRLVRFET